MKKRSELTSAELPELHEQLNRRLDGLGIETQPEVAMRLLELVSDPDAGLHDFADVIRHDQALSGRLLRLSNSAFFGQRQPVTNIDRACVLLGRERLRACSLGFYLSRAATSDAASELSRQVWGQSVFRGCLASELARSALPAFTSEAFVVGLMLDSGVPLMQKLLGEAYAPILVGNPTPAEIFAREFQRLSFTHADVVAALMKRWKMPELLGNPIAWHHVAPGATHRNHAVFRMQRIAHYAGAIDLRTPPPAEDAPLPAVAFRVLGFTEDQLSDAVRRATLEYQTTVDVFGQVAEKVPDQDTLSQRVHNELLTATENLLITPVGPGPGDGITSAHRFRLGGYEVEVESVEDGYAVLYLIDNEGHRLISYRFLPPDESPQSLRGALGLEACDDDEAEELSTFLSRLAA